MIADAQKKPIRTVIGWQIAATAISVVLCVLVAGATGAASAALGGAVAVAGSVTYMLLLPRGTKTSPWDVLSGVLRAEGAKVGVMVALLWLVMVVFRQIFVIGFIGTFTVAVIIFSMAIFVRNSVPLEMDKSNVD